MQTEDDWHHLGKANIDFWEPKVSKVLFAAVDRIAPLYKLSCLCDAKKGLPCFSGFLSRSLSLLLGPCSRNGASLLPSLHLGLLHNTRIVSPKMPGGNAFLTPWKSTSISEVQPIVSAPWRSNVMPYDFSWKLPLWILYFYSRLELQTTRRDLWGKVISFLSVILPKQGRLLL